jgi:hypothetical protein
VTEEALLAEVLREDGEGDPDDFMISIPILYTEPTSHAVESQYILPPGSGTEGCDPPPGAAVTEEELLAEVLREDGEGDPDDFMMAEDDPSVPLLIGKVVGQASGGAGRAHQMTQCGIEYGIDTTQDSRVLWILARSRFSG